MSGNSIGKLFTVTSFGESHGLAIGCIVDGCPPGLELTEADIQPDLDRRKPGTSRHTTQRREADQVQILSGVFEGKTTGTPIALFIHNTDQRSKYYGDIAQKFRPGHADYTYTQKYGVRDYRGGGRSSARETAMRVAAGAIAKKYLEQLLGIKVRAQFARKLVKLTRQNGNRLSKILSSAQLSLLLSKWKIIWMLCARKVILLVLKSPLLLKVFLQDLESLYLIDLMPRLRIH